MRDRPIVEIAQGRVAGTWRGDSAAFLGLPFAEAPVGDLRFAAPLPARGWDGVRDAAAYGPTPQRRPFAEVTSIPEPSIPGDATLNVNVFTPQPGRRDAALPVFVWIHGGGFKAGSPASPWYDGFAFNRDGVVTVSLSYRLGFVGFGWVADAPHNRGLLDQLEALRWVRANIAAFGGDPGNVTIGGQSAGGGSALALLLVPQARDLFHAAISHSGAFDPLPLDAARAAGEQLAAAAGVPATRAGWSAVPEDRILDLQDAVRAAPAGPPTLDAVVAGTLASGSPGGLPFRPFLDGDLLDLPTDEALAAGRADGVPLLLGTTAHEFTQAGQSLALLVRGVDLAVLLHRHLGDLAGDYLAAHADLADRPALVIGQLLTDTTFRTAVPRWADGRRGPTWAYDFHYPGPSGLALHCADLPFAWDHLGAALVAESDGPNPPQALADAMHGAWVTFIATHEAPWPGWDARGTTRVFDETGGVAPGYALERRLLRAAGQFRNVDVLQM